MANYLRYANKGATRNQGLDPRLVEALGFLPDLGVTAEVFSGGQPATGLGRIGSHRHDHGQAGDMNFYMGDRKLDWSNPDDVPIFQQIVSKAKERGVTGFGAGPGYMSPGSMHVGFGTPAIWGAKGSSDNAPEWLRTAYGMGPSNRTGVAPRLPEPIEVASRPIAGIEGATPMMKAATPPVDVASADRTFGDKLGAAIFGEENAASLKKSFGAGADPTNPMAVGLGMMQKATAQQAPREDPIQSSLPAFEAADSQRMAAAQQLMSSLMGARRPRGLQIGRMV